MSPRGARVELRGFGWRPLGRRHQVVSGLDLLVEPGQRVLLSGPSGAGKSTILRACAGVLGTTVAGELDGEISVEGRLGLVMQNPGDAVVADRIGRDVAFGPENACVPRDQIWERVRRALTGVALGYPLDHPTSALSGGELQRLALAGVLALRPGLLLLDEPTSMLDDANARAVRTAIVDAVAQTGATLLVVEHRIAPWLDQVDRVVVLDRDGGIAADTSPDALVTDFGSRLADHGVWMPGVAAPAPLDLPAELVAPSASALSLCAEDLHVDLRTRTLRGPVVSRALRGVDADLEAGSVTAFTGPSGAGKSTLVGALAGLVAPTSGRIAGVDRPLHRWRSKDLARRVGWVPQNPEHGFLTVKVRDEVAHTAARLGIAVDTEAILEVFGLTHLAEANPYQLSGGEQRRLAVAAALAHRPAVVLLDEPTVGQDRHTWAATAGWLTSAARSGAAVGLSTHDADLIALAGVETHLRHGRNAEKNGASAGGRR